jgi:hypothetical protein
MNLNPWAVAMETQLSAYKMVCDLKASGRFSNDFRYGWALDKRLLEHAQPTYWNAETVDACMAAAKSIPLDTKLNRWNFGEEVCWWYFDKPLPYVTVSEKTALVRALCFGQLPLESGGRGMPCSVWTDRWFSKEDVGHTAASMMARCPVAPSQTFEWEGHLDLGQMLETNRKFHQLRYGPGGPDEGDHIIGEDLFMEATEGITRFILAAVAWMGQRILVPTSGPIERHRRKEVARTIRPIDAVRVVHLRRRSYPKSEGEKVAGPSREYDFRWVVSGHWRNQACGPKLGDRRLTYIEAYPKGPDDKPFKTPEKKVYVVDR